MAVRRGFGPTPIDGFGRAVWRLHQRGWARGSRECGVSQGASREAEARGTMEWRGYKERRCASARILASPYGKGRRKQRRRRRRRARSRVQAALKLRQSGHRRAYSVTYLELREGQGCQGAAFGAKGSAVGAVGAVGALHARSPTAISTKTGPPLRCPGIQSASPGRFTMLRPRCVSRLGPPKVHWLEWLRRTPITASRHPGAADEPLAAGPRHPSRVRSGTAQP